MGSTNSCCSAKRPNGRFSWRRKLANRYDTGDKKIYRQADSHIKETLEDILKIEDAGYNEKNKAEELIAFVNQMLGT